MRNKCFLLHKKRKKGKRRKGRKKGKGRERERERESARENQGDQAMQKLRRRETLAIE